MRQIPVNKVKLAGTITSNPRATPSGRVTHQLSVDAIGHSAHIGRTRIILSAYGKMAERLEDLGPGDWVKVTGRLRSRYTPAGEYLGAVVDVVHLTVA